MSSRHDVLIAGGGMVGLALAALLADDPRLRVVLVDAGPRPAFDAGAGVSLRVSAVSPGSVAILSRIGAWTGIVSTRACPYRHMRVWDAAGSVDGPETLRFDADEFALRELGFIVENVLVRHTLLEVLDRRGVDVRYGMPIESLQRAGRRFAVGLGPGGTLHPDLLVGADGANSTVRGRAQIAVRSWPHAQKAFVTCLETELGHRDTAWQRFLETGPIGLLPLQDGRVSIVWSTTPEEADSAMAMPDDRLAERLAEVTDGALGRLTPAGPRGTFPLQSRHAAAYVQDGLALVGDAAHTVHPLAGQGVNLGLADADALAREVVAALDADENPGDLPTLRRYERARRGANRTMQGFVSGLNRLFSNRSAPLARLRGAGMYLFNRSGPIRERAVQTALGIR